VSTLSSLSDELFGATDRLLGDPFTYTPHGGDPLSLVGFVSYGTQRRDLGGSAVMTSDAAVEVSKSDVPSWNKLDVITLPRTGQQYAIKQAGVDDSGRSWLFLLTKKVA
jgi:hypothetical protein